MNIRKILIIIGVLVVLVLAFGFLSLNATGNAITGFSTKGSSFENEYFEMGSTNEIIAEVNQTKGG